MVQNKYNKVFCSWSGGKDCCLALDRFIKYNHECKIYLLTMINNETKRTYGHHLSENSLKKQAEALGHEIIFGYSDKDDYEEKWCMELNKLKKIGITAGIFGDIDLEVHFVWIHRVLSKINLEMLMPLWKENRMNIVEEIIQKKYKPIIISVKKEIEETGLLGKVLNSDTISIMKKFNIDPSGEDGDFHSFVVDGPIFKNEINLSADKIIEINNHMVIDVEENLTVSTL